MPLMLRTGAPDAGTSDQNAVSRAEWLSKAIKELKTLELEGQRRQRAVIGQLGRKPLFPADHKEHIRVRHAWMVVSACFMQDCLSTRMPDSQGLNPSCKCRLHVYIQSVQMWAASDILVCL